MEIERKLLVTHFPPERTAIRSACGAGLWPLIEGRQIEKVRYVIPPSRA